MTTYITSLKMLETVNSIIITISLGHFYVVCVLLSSHLQVSPTMDSAPFSLTKMLVSLYNNLATLHFF